MDTESNLSAAPDENGDEFMRNELARLRELHGDDSDEQWAFLNKTGTERLIAMSEGRSFQTFSPQMNADILELYKNGTRDLAVGGDQDALVDQADAVAGWLLSINYNNQDMLQAVDFQTSICMELWGAADQGRAHWQNLGHEGRVQMLDMIAKATQHLMRKCTDIIWDPETEKKYRTTDIIVTDKDSPLVDLTIKKPKFYSNALSEREKIYYARFSDFDGTEDPEFAVTDLAHEQTHFLTTMWFSGEEDRTGLAAIDEVIHDNGWRMMDTYRVNAEHVTKVAADEKGKELAAQLETAERKIYKAAAEERLASTMENRAYEQNKYGTPNKPRVEQYCDLLSDDERFKPLIDVMRQYKQRYVNPFRPPTVV